MVAKEIAGLLRILFQTIRSKGEICASSDVSQHGTSNLAHTCDESDSTTHAAANPPTAPSSNRLAGKVCIVTGAGAGFGRGIVKKSPPRVPRSSASTCTRRTARQTPRWRPRAVRSHSKVTCRLRQTGGLH
jgi:hypothetical protein